MKCVTSAQAGVQKNLDKPGFAAFAGMTTKALISVFRHPLRIYLKSTKATKGN